ncbi:hypothetical protein BY458DRAFT_52396 [Sporodiniella umbellata]|nr:hypothetical protein BY458DRAFT_52396 [Sporodiniella umbellata]
MVKENFLSVFWKKRNNNRIEHYRTQIRSLEKSIQRSLVQLQNANYLFAVYADRQTAYKAYDALKVKKKEKHPLIYNVSFAPHPKDIVWKSMHLDTDSFRLKRRFGYALFISFLFVAMIPIAIIAAFSNLINILRICRKPLGNYRVVVDLVQSYFAPWFMFILFAIAIWALRYITRQQACKTESGIEQSTIFKTYIFFVIDHLLAFTTFNSMIGILGQMTDMSPFSSLNNLMVSNYIYQIGKNAASSSIYWISYTCINIVGLFFSFLRPSTLFMKKKETLENFVFSRNYALIISLFTSTLVYSVTAPIVLPFSFMYFGAATVVFKYELVYIYTVKADTYGRIWPMLYCVTIMSVIFFQLIMIATLRLKGGWFQVYSLIPLPILTSAALLYTRVLSHRMYVSTDGSTETEETISLYKIEEVFRDPILSKTSEAETAGPSDTKNSILNMPYNPFFEVVTESGLEIAIDPTIEASAPDISILVNTEKPAFKKIE